MAPAEQENDDSAGSNPENGLKIGAPVRVPKLDNIRACVREAGTLYSEARKREGRFPNAQTAQRLANVLAQVRANIELGDLEQRLREEFDARLKALEVGGRE